MKKIVCVSAIAMSFALGFSQDNFEPNNSFSDAVSISNCQQLDANIDSVSDVDFYQLNVNDTQPIDFNIFYIPLPLTIKITVFDSSTTEITSVTSTSNTLNLNFTPASVETHFIKIEEINTNFSSENYHFLVVDSTCPVDTDGDSLFDNEETNTDINDADTDDDGVSDAVEFFAFTTNPTLRDTDNDGIFDGTEIGVSMPLADTDGSVGNFMADADAGLTTTNPIDADSDDDGISDGDEDLNKDGLVATNMGETNPLNPDTDNDGLFDGTEVGVSTPLTDTDVSVGNFIADADAGVTITNPLSNDTDGDSLLDGQEDANHNGSTDSPIIGGTGTVGSGETDPNDADSDDDSLSDSDEVNIFGTNPLDFDTDDGGIDDGTEVNSNPATNPLDPNDDGTLSLNETNSNQFIIYPNPSKDNIHITLYEKQGLIQVYDITGKLVLKTNFNSTTKTTTIDLENLKTGLYLIKVTTETGQSVKRVLKN